MIHYIYGLSSSKDGIIRYIGQTTQILERRKNQHKCDALSKLQHNHKCNWIRKVYADGYEINITLIEETNEKEWASREIYWINESKYSKNLVNQLKGGESGGLGGKIQNFASYDEAKKIIQTELPYLNSISKYKKFFTINSKYIGILPKNPNDVYALRGDWVSWGDYLGTGRISDNKKHSQYIPFVTLREIIHTQHLQSRSEYELFREHNELYPLHPDRVYQKEWKGWYDFLGKDTNVKCSYNVFLRYMKRYFRFDMSMYKYRCLYQSKSINKRLPYHPERIYNKTWKSILQDILT